MKIISAYLDLIARLTYSPPTWATAVAGVFVLITLVLSLYLLFEHLAAYKNPEVLQAINCNWNYIFYTFLLLYHILD